jgi:hypothetical protein
MTKEISSLVQKFSETFGDEELVKLLSSKLERSATENVLTIICDNTLHKIPSDLIEGELFIFSSGSFDTSSEQAMRTYLEDRVLALFVTLNTKTWKRIRLIYSGHAILASTAKLAVYRVTHLETEDVLYFGEKGYLRISLRLRDLLGNSVR